MTHEFQFENHRSISTYAAARGTEHRQVMFVLKEGNHITAGSVAPFIECVLSLAAESPQKKNHMREMLLLSPFHR